MRRRKEQIITSEEIQNQINTNAARVKKLTEEIKELKLKNKTLNKQLQETLQKEAEEHEKAQYEALIAFLRENNITIEELWERLPKVENTDE